VSARKVPLENLFCLRCNREIEVGHKSVAVYMFAQTVGIRPRQKSSAQRICFCPQCSVSLAMGPPPEGALNLAAWNMIRDLVGADPALNQAAWENLRGVVGLLPSGEPESIPRRAAAERLLRVLISEWSSEGVPRPSFAWAGFFVTDLVNSFGVHFSKYSLSRVTRQVLI